MNLVPIVVVHIYIIIYIIHTVYKKPYCDIVYNIYICLYNNLIFYEEWAAEAAGAAEAAANIITICSSEQIEANSEIELSWLTFLYDNNSISKYDCRNRQHPQQYAAEHLQKRAVISHQQIEIIFSQICQLSIISKSYYYYVVSFYVKRNCCRRRLPAGPKGLLATCGGTTI